jgi:hypothetical protein
LSFISNAADDVRIAAEHVLPVGVAEDQHRRRVLAVIVGPEGAAENRRDAEDLEEIVRHHAGLHPRRLARAEQVESHLVIFDKCVE